MIDNVESHGDASATGLRDSTPCFAERSEAWECETAVEKLGPQEGSSSQSGAEMDAFAQSHAIYQGGGRQRLEMEARLLARQTDDEIARAMGLSPEVAAAYERRFYTVRNMLHAKVYILYEKIGLNPSMMTGETRIDTLMKLSVYLHGPMMIPAWLAYLDRLAHPMPPPVDLQTREGRDIQAIERYVAVAGLSSDQAAKLLMKMLPHLARGSAKRRSRRSKSIGSRDDLAAAVFQWIKNESGRNPCREL
jgi:hypothetical protein